MTIAGIDHASVPMRDTEAMVTFHLLEFMIYGS